MNTSVFLSHWHADQNLEDNGLIMPQAKFSTKIHDKHTMYAGADYKYQMLKKTSTLECRNIIYRKRKIRNLF
ncbi:MAG: hypothetical protein A2275_18335 [Bacteroidetes bacterium RIFOXYA12_FULL_35_11]|nr:MAG: hypothetical protein A2X01_15065 [Bacteroidetes bacterium GWF2_35_48]OFY82729.1 MAG: hypothetical protein A2275_18335 [Bacteroidetes bacterium RIFOXYA12_FULL_35_11]OFY95294.1 MAG: hypothetical protein A2309_09140 [Bacteroidetes bacterium RIFOXYB2_FULL_35_7]OFY96979.1 MAG: hypothetical protein A2491_11920 [Bacteroidetes bacterium RIFOXYC12_FULL_35_7]HBX52309.1 hypothetical protein [Bacteroidales bacterium]